MAWDSILAKDFCKSVRDGTHDTPKQMEMGYKLVTSKCIHDGFIFPEEAYFISEKDYRAINERSLVEQWDVLMSMIGNGLGRSAVVKQKPDYAIKNLALFKVGDEYKAKWLHYYLSSPVGQGLIYNSLQGSGQPFISLNLLRNFAIPNPPYEAIKKIVSVLELYDNLIENNQKQIKLLEEAAQRLYKQWFIDLRYPGHETTPIVDGLPEGWGKEKLGNVIEYIRGTSYTSSELSDSDGVLMVNLKNINAFGGYKRNAEKRFTGKYKEIGILEPGDLVMGCTDMTKERRLVGHVALIPNLKERAVFTMDLLKILPKTISKTFLYAQCRFGGLSYKIAPLANGANVLHLRPENMADIEVLCPAKSIVEMYDNVFASMISKIEKLEDQIQLASESRNRLLPKLMNGELEV